MPSLTFNWHTETILILYQNGLPHTQLLSDEKKKSSKNKYILISGQPVIHRSPEGLNYQYLKS